MKRNVVRLISASGLLIALTVGADAAATNVAWAAMDPSAGHEQTMRRKAVCRTMGREEWFLVTGQDSEYGGTFCVR
ncbi:MAG: hypothetical protein IT305_18560 [Chloroflexi bacterium]|nr:hypothetical protein [Chloroflexota bacterium]